MVDLSFSQKQGARKVKISYIILIVKPISRIAKILKGAIEPLMNIGMRMGMQLMSPYNNLIEWFCAKAIVTKKKKEK